MLALRDTLRRRRPHVTQTGGTPMDRTGSPSGFDASPLVVIWEVSRACDLACVHCRAAAVPMRDPRELTTEEGCQFIRSLRGFGRPVFVLTGGDPLKRPDID